MEILENAIQWLENVYRTRSRDWIYTWLSPDQIPEKDDGEGILPGKAYFTITLESMRVVDVRRGLTNFYGVVHSFIKVPHLAGKPAQFNVVISPNKLKNIESRYIDRVVSVGQPLVGPIPYYHGVNVEIGLFSVASANLTEEFIALLESMSKAAGVSFIGTAMPFIGPLSRGISLLTSRGGDSSILEIGLSTTFETLKTGWFLVMRAPKTIVDGSNFRVTSGDNRLVDNLGNPIGDYPYMVFRVSSSVQRYNWFEIPELSEAYETLMEDVRRLSYDAAKESLYAFRRKALTSPDLLRDDARKLSKKVDSEVKEILKTSQMLGGESPNLPPLREIDLYN